MERDLCIRRTGRLIPKFHPAEIKSTYRKFTTVNQLAFQRNTSISSASCTAIACGVKASSCTTWIRSRNQRKSRIAKTVSLGMKSRKEVVTSPVTARSGTIATPSFLSRDNCDSTSNVRILSTSSPKSQYDKDIPKQTKRRQ